MERSHRWHWAEWVLIVLCVFAVLSNSYFYFKNGNWWTLAVACMAFSALVFFLIRRPRSSGDQVMDLIIKKISSKESGE